MFSKMFSYRALLGASVCLLPLLPMAAAADDFDVDEKPAETAVAPPSQNWITIGGQYNSGRTDYFNRFSGTEAPGVNALGEIHWNSNDAWDSGGTHYFSFIGDRLGQPDRSVAVRVGEQGVWGLNAGYDGIYYDGGHNYQSIYTTSGGLIPQIAPGSLTFGYTKLYPAGTFNGGAVNPLWQPTLTTVAPTDAYQLSLQRDIYTLGGKYQFGDWLVTAGWRHEHKQGWQPQSLTIAGKPSLSSSSASQPTTFTSGMAYFIQPINYDTDRFDLSAQYATKIYQAQLSYSFSQFKDNEQLLVLNNPWAFSPSANYGTPANIAANYILPPDNSAQQFKGLFGLNITPTTRLNVNLGYGIQEQNQQFVNGTGNPAVTNYALPTQNLQGFIETIFANIAVTSRPIKGLDLRLSYTLDDRDNETPTSYYTHIDTVSATNSNYSAPNLPFTFRHQTVAAEAGYRVWGQTKLSLSDSLDSTYRSYASATEVQTNRTTVKLRGPMLDDVFGSLSAAYEDRWAQNYNPNGTWAYFNATSNPDNATDPKNFLMFYETSRKHAEFKASVDATPFDGVSVSLMGKLSQDTYPANSLGMRNNHNFSVGPDIAWDITKALSLHAFYNYQEIYYDESALYTTGSLSLPFKIADTDSAQTLGVDVEWKAIPNKLKITLNGNLAYGDTAYALGEGVVPLTFTTNSWTTIGAITVTPLPAVTSMMYSLSMRGEYTINPNTSVLFGYAFERFNYKDFANNIGATQYANAFLPGTANPNEAVHVFSAAVRMRF